MLWTIDKTAQVLFIGCVSWLLSGILGFVGLINGWIGFITFWIAGSLMYLALDVQKIGAEGKAVLITGCDTGFGYNLALHLDKLGFRVFAGCLLADKNGEGAQTLKETGSKRLHVLQMNITKEDEVRAAREAVDKLLPKDEVLWAVVNNAGLSTFGNVEWVPVSTYKRITECNFFGLIIVTKAFLPLLRKSRGRLINVASMLGRMGVPMRSPYVSSKFAVEGFSDCLRQEMRENGVKVIVLEPGNFVAGTAIFSPEAVQKQGDEMWQSMTQEARDDYGEENFKNQIDIMKVYITIGDTDITPVINSFEEAITQKYPQARYQPMDLYYKTRIFVATHLPEWIHDFIYFGALDK